MPLTFGEGLGWGARASLSANSSPRISTQPNPHLCDLRLPFVHPVQAVLILLPKQTPLQVCVSAGDNKPLPAGSTSPTCREIKTAAGSIAATCPHSSLSPSLTHTLPTHPLVPNCCTGTATPKNNLQP